MPIRQPEAWVGGEMLPVYIISTEMPKKISGFKRIGVFFIRAEGSIPRRFVYLRTSSVPKFSDRFAYRCSMLLFAYR